MHNCRPLSVLSELAPRPLAPGRHLAAPLPCRDPALAGITCCDWERSAAGHVVLGLSPPPEASSPTGSPPVALVDLTAQRVVATAPGGGGVTALRAAGRLLACGGRTGELVLRDTRTLKAEQTIAAFAGGEKSYFVLRLQ